VTKEVRGDALPEVNLEVVVRSPEIQDAETLEKELSKARKHSAMLQSKIDGAFAQYHNEVQDTPAKSDGLVRKNSRYARRTKVCRCHLVEYLLLVPYSRLTSPFELFADLEARVEQLKA
jgi:hypothetical protein